MLKTIWKIGSAAELKKTKTKVGGNSVIAQSEVFN